MDKKKWLVMDVSDGVSQECDTKERAEIVKDSWLETKPTHDISIEKLDE